MAWVRIDDQFHDHPKVLEVGPLAECLYVRGLAYAARYLTDGFIPVGHLRRMGDMDAIEEAGKLVDAGLWDIAEKGYQIHDYLDYQPSADKVKGDREAARVRMEKARAGKQHPNDEDSSDEVRPNKPRSSHNPVPSRPVPNVEVPDGTSGRDAHDGTSAPALEKTKAKRKHKVPENFTVTDDMREWAASAVSDMTSPELAAETEKFVDHFTAKGELRLDWVASWRNWIRRSIDFKPTGQSRASPNGKGSGRNGGYTVAELHAMGRKDTR